MVDNPILWLLCKEVATPFIPVERKNQAFLPPLQWGEILSEFIVLFLNTGDSPLKRFLLPWFPLLGKIYPYVECKKQSFLPPFLKHIVSSTSAKLHVKQILWDDNTRKWLEGQENYVSYSREIYNLTN